MKKCDQASCELAPANDTEPVRCGQLPVIILTRLPRGQARPTWVPTQPDRLWSGYHAS